LSQSIWIVELGPNARPFANVAQPNHLASLLALGIIGVVHGFESRRCSGLLATVVLCVLGLGLIATRSRTGALFVLLLMVWTLLCRRRAGLRTPVRAVVLGSFAFFAGSLVWDRVNEALLLNSASDLSERLAPGMRLTHWRTLSDAVEQSPWWGYGWGQVAVAQQAVVANHPATYEQLAHSHNLALDLVIYNGVPLGVLFVALIALWIAQQIAVTREADRFALLGAICALLLHALLEYPLHYAYFLLPCALMIGTVEALSADTPQTAPIRHAFSIPRAVFVTLVVAEACILGWVGVEYAQMETATRQQRFDTAGIGPSPSSTEPPNVLLLDQLREFHRFASAEARPAMLPHELEWMRRVVLRSPYPPALLRLALALGLNGRSDEAETILTNLCKTTSPLRCEEGRAAWRILQGKHPELVAVRYPD
jgi:hypothetical protein